MLAWLVKIFVACCRVAGLARPIAGIDVDDGRRHPQTRRHIALLEFIESSGVPKTARILDVGCGAGHLLARMRRAGYSNLAGCDIEPAGPEGIEYRQIDLDADGLAAYPSGSADAVIASEVLEHLENPARALRDFRRVVRDGGAVFITVPHCSNLYERFAFLFSGNSTRYRSERVSGPRSHISMFPSRIFESLTDRAGLKIEECRGTYALRFGHFWGSTSRPFLSYSIMYRLTPLHGGPRENRGGPRSADPD